MQSSRDGNAWSHRAHVRIKHGLALGCCYYAEPGQKYPEHPLMSLPVEFCAEKGLQPMRLNPLSQICKYLTFQSSLLCSASSRAVGPPLLKNRGSVQGAAAKQVCFRVRSIAGPCRGLQRCQVNSGYKLVCSGSSRLRRKPFV